MREFILYLCQPLGFLIQMFPPAWMTLYIFRGEYPYPFRRMKGILLGVLLLLTLLFTAGTLHGYFSGSDKIYLTANLIFAVCLACCFALFVVLTKTTLRRKLFAFILMLNYACFILSLTNILLSKIFVHGSGIDHVPYHPLGVLILGILSAALTPLFYRAIYRKYLDNRWDMRGKDWNILLGAQMIYFLPACVFSLFINHLFDTRISSLLLGALFFTQLVIYVIALRILELSEEKRKAELAGEYARQNMRLQEQQYESLKEVMELTRKQRHDIEHHFTLLYAMSQKEENLPKLRAYLEEYLLENSVKNVRFCDNYTVNVFLNHYARLCGERQIILQVQADLPEELWIKDIHLSNLFGNALKNALEACIQCRNREMEAAIVVQAAIIQHALVLRMENTSVQKAVREEGGWLSSKREGYGTGLSVIEDVAKLYQGDVKIEQENNRFILKTILYGG